MSLSFVTDLAKSTISRAVFGKDQPNINFTVGELVEPPDFGFIWSIFNGTKKDDGSAVTVFAFDCVKQRDKVALAKNAFKKLKMLRHPLMPKYIDGAETDSQIIYATEPLIPLKRILSTSSSSSTEDQAMKALGLYKIAKIVSFINTEAGMIHGNINTRTVFSTKAGEWKLCGLELASSIKEDNPTLTQFHQLPETKHYSPPEVHRDSWTTLRANPVGAVDAWAFYCLIFEVFNGRHSRSEDLVNKGSIPPPLHQLARNLCKPDAASRDTVANFLQRGTSPSAYFDTPLIKCSVFLEQWSLKEQYEKDDFIRQIATSIDSFPIDFSKFKVLPELITALEYGGAGAKALTPILKIGSKLNNQREFDELIGPAVIKLFASPDRAIRVTLCENIGQFVGNLNEKTVTEKIFPNLAVGFSDSNAIVREQTLKAILGLTPKLNEKILNNDLLRFLAKLQNDEEPGIRTNTIVCIGKISRFLSEATRKKVLVPAFSRSLQDSFPPARNSSLLAYAATVDYYDAAEICQRIIPSISPLTLDPEEMIRKQALKNLHLFLGKLETHVNQLPKLDPKPMQNGTVSNNQTNPSSEPGWTGWAMSKITSTVTSSISGTVSTVEKLTSSTSPSTSSQQLTATNNASLLPSSSSYTQPSSISSSYVDTPPVVSSSSFQVKPNAASSIAYAPSTSATNKPAAVASSGWDEDFGDDGWDNEPKVPVVSDSWNSGSVKQPSPRSSIGGSGGGMKLGGGGGGGGGMASSIAVNPAAAVIASVSNDGWGNNKDDFGWDDTPAIVQPTKSSTVTSNDSWNTASTTAANNGWGSSSLDDDDGDSWGNSTMVAPATVAKKSTAPSAVDKEERRKRMEEQREQRKRDKLGAKKI